MGRVLDCLDDELTAWIARQAVFFVATAPRADDGHVNCSPRGMDTLRVLDPRTIAWVDLTGSGAETVAHLRENGRIVVMWCAFEGPPRVLRVHGHGVVLLPGEPEFAALRPNFPDLPGARAIVKVAATRVSTSCGFGVPKFELVGPRDELVAWTERKGRRLPAYRAEHNARSIDGLPAFDARREQGLEG